MVYLNVADTLPLPPPPSTHTHTRKALKIKKINLIMQVHPSKCY